jgi:hypothetical protein
MDVLFFILFSPEKASRLAQNARAARRLDVQGLLVTVRLDRGSAAKEGGIRVDAGGEAVPKPMSS